MEREHRPRARVRVEVVDEKRLFARRQVRERQRPVGRVEGSRDAFDVLLNLVLDANKSGASRLGLANADRVPVEEQHVVHVPVGPIDSNSRTATAAAAARFMSSRSCSVQPASLERLIDSSPCLRFRGV